MTNMDIAELLSPIEPDDSILNNVKFYRSNTGTFEKRDIVEVATDLGLDLEEKGYNNRPYYTCECPYHMDGNRDTFRIYPNIQRFICYVCYPESGDVIDLVKQHLGCEYEEALKIAATTVPSEQVFEKLMAKIAEPPRIDKMMYASRSNKLFNIMDFDTAQGILMRIDSALGRGKPGEVDMILKRVGV